jgi:DNA modification methylase
MPIAGLQSKDMVGMPWRLALALQASGWRLRQDIIWHKPNAMPESTRDRPTTAHEYLFLLAKSDRYYYNGDAIRERCAKQGTPGHVAGGAGKRAGTREGLRRRAYDPKRGRNRRSVWRIPVEPYAGSHFATFPKALVRPCILAGCRPGGIVLDPFAGSGTVGEVADEELRHSVLIELNPEYVPLIRRRVGQPNLFW